MKHVLILAVAASFLSHALFAQAVPTSVSDPLRFASGEKVTSPDEWPKRRDELRELLLKLEYGHLPPAPGNVTRGATLESGTRFNEATRFEAFKIHFGPESALAMTVHTYVPANTEAPLPVILRFGLGGEHAQAANERDYAFVCFEQTELDPDTEGYDEAGPAQKAYPDHDWGSLAVWAWSASRALDYLETSALFDTTKAVITGHSRTGKAALLAGALDERFTLVVPNGSGCGGAAAFRDPPKKVETLELITRADRFKSWFHKDFGQFADREDDLPFDQHFLRALVAPRPVLSTDAYGDQWCNPPGTQLAWQWAQPTFDFLGVSKNNLIHFREGGHDQLAPDFAVLLDVADHFLKGKPLPQDLQQPPFPNLNYPSK